MNNTDLASQRAMDRVVKLGFDAASPLDRTLATVWLYCAGVSNQGFARYFAGSRGDLAFHAPTALRAIGALDHADIAQRANDCFGPDGPPRERAARRARMALWSTAEHDTFLALEQRFFESEEDVDPLLEEYLARAEADAHTRRADSARVAY